MKSIKLLLLFLFCLLLPTLTLAFEFKTVDQKNSNYILAADQEITDNLVIVANKAEILGKVNGDLIILAQDTDISGIITGNLAVAALNITLAGQVGKDAVILSQDAILSKDAIIGQDLTVWANSINKSDEVKIGRKTWLKPQATTTPTFSAKQIILKVLFNVLVLTLLGGLLLWFLPQPLNLAVQTVKANPLKSFWVGTAAFFGGPIIIMFLLLTIIGWAAAIVAAFLLWIIVFAAPILAGFILGKFLIGTKYPALFSLVFGLLIYKIVILTPYLGQILGFVVILICLGGSLMTIYKIGKQ